MRNFATVGAAIAATAIALLLLAEQRSTNSDNTDEASAAASPGPDAPATSAFGSRGRLADTAADGRAALLTRSYRLVSETHLTLADKAGEDANGPPFRLAAELRGTLRATDVERGDEKTVVQLVMREAQVATNQYEGTRLAASETSRLDDLDHPFYAVYERSGRLAEVYVPPETPLERRNTMRTIAAALQYCPPPADRGTWSGREVVAGVETNVRYQQRERGRYEKTYETAERSGRAIVVVRDDHLAHLRSDETVSSSALGLEGTGAMHLELLETAPNEAATAEWTTDRVVATAAGVTAEVDRAAARRAAFAALDDGTSTADLLAMLRATPLAADGGRSQTYLMRRLAARLTLHPDEAAAAAAAVGDLDAHEAAAVIGALSSVDTEQAEAALAEVLADDDTPAELVADAANALGFHETPGDAAIEALQRLAASPDRERRGPGLLGLGSVSFRLGQRDDPRGDELVRDLLDRYAAATSEQQRVDLLAALGNTGSELILPAIEATLQNGSPRLRHEAVVSLRLVRAARADQLLTRFLGPAEPQDLRLAALFAARFRPLDRLLPALSNLMRTDPDANARGEALELLGDRLAELAAIRPVLEWVAERDADERLRERARALLARA